MRFDPDTRAWYEFIEDEHPERLDTIVTERVVCPGCRGYGKHATPALRDHGFTQTERDEMGDDWYEFMDDYRAGVYDVICDTCGGANVVDEIDIDKCPEWIRMSYIGWMRDAAQDRAITAMERSMGA